MEEYDYILKIVLLGESSAGKTCIAKRFCNNDFDLEKRSTIGVDFLTKIIPVYNGINVKLQIWDTAGQERFNSVTKKYLRDNIGCLIVFSLDSKESFEEVDKWYKMLIDVDDKPKVIWLVGNKNDIEHREVREKEAIEKAKLLSEQKDDITVSYIETSAYTGFNINELFDAMSDEIVNKHQNGLIKVRRPENRDYLIPIDDKPKKCCTLL